MPNDAMPTYLTTEELAVLIRYDARTIRNRLKDSVLLEGIHYIRPFGGRKILFIREAIERDLNSAVTKAESRLTADEAPAATSPVRARKPRAETMIPMAAGGYCNG